KRAFGYRAPGVGKATSKPRQIKTSFLSGNVPLVPRQYLRAWIGNCGSVRLRRGHSTRFIGRDRSGIGGGTSATERCRTSAVIGTIFPGGRSSSIIRLRSRLKGLRFI